MQQEKTKVTSFLRKKPSHSLQFGQAGKNRTRTSLEKCNRSILYWSPTFAEKGATKLTSYVNALAEFGLDEMHQK